MDLHLCTCINVFHILAFFINERSSSMIIDKQNIEIFNFTIHQIQALIHDLVNCYIVQVWSNTVLMVCYDHGLNFFTVNILNDEMEIPSVMNFQSI